ncbi:MAG: hypothetical protein ACE5F1_21490 [Planctomycetota bacterium]
MASAVLNRTDNNGLQARVRRVRAVIVLLPFCLPVLAKLFASIFQSELHGGALRSFLAEAMREPLGTALALAWTALPFLVLAGMAGRLLGPGASAEQHRARAVALGCALLIGSGLLYDLYRPVATGNQWSAINSFLLFPFYCGPAMVLGFFLGRLGCHILERR